MNATNHRNLTASEIAKVQSALSDNLEVSAIEADGYMTFTLGGLPLFIKSTRLAGSAERAVTGLHLSGKSRIERWHDGAHLMLFVVSVNYAPLSDDDGGPLGCTICDSYELETQ